MKDIDLGMMAGAGIIPPPFARADQIGLDEVLAKLERAAREWGENFEPPTILRRLVAQGRLGRQDRPGLLPVRPARRGLGREPGQARDPRRGRDRVARPAAGELDLARGRARAARRSWDAVAGRTRPGAGVRLGQPDAVLRRRRHQGVHDDGRRAGGKELRRPDARAAADDGALERRDDRGRQRAGASAAAASSRWRCDFRIAGESATFGQPEINLGIIPGFGGTQRLPRLVGEAKALEMNLIGDPIAAEEAYELGLATRSCPTTSCSTPRWRGRASSPGRRRWPSSRSSGCRPPAISTPGSRPRSRGSPTVFGSEDAREGISAFLRSAGRSFSGK